MTTTALTRALRAKYGTGRAGRAAVLRKLGLLGLDEDLLLSAPPAPSSSNNNGGNVQALRTELEKMLGSASWNNLSDEQTQEIYALLDEHAPPDARDQGEEDDREARLEKLRTFLSRKGFGEDDIQRACDAVVKGHDVGRDYAAGEPRNVFEGGLRGGQIAGDAAIKHLVDRIVVEPSFGGAPRMSERDRRQAMDAATAAVNGYADLVREFPDIARIRTG